VRTASAFPSALDEVASPRPSRHCRPKAALNNAEQCLTSQ
jgi:hypothetical protein